MTILYDDRDGQERAAREAALFSALRQSLAKACDASPTWRDRLGSLPIDTIKTRADLARLPVLRKSDLPELQRNAPPFGDLWLTGPGSLAHLFISPGPIFDPEGTDTDWWGAARALSAAGFRAGDIVLNTFSYHLTPAGAMFESGARALGCPVIPAGPGNTEDQLVAIRQFRPTAYVGTPDFLKIILDKADAEGVDISCIGKAIVSGAALPASLFDIFTARGITMRQCYGTADLGIVAYEADGAGMVVNEDVIVEIVQSGTGDPVARGDVGEVLVTRLNRDYPLFRFATGDMSAIIDPPDDSPWTNDRIKGWLGRADQTAKVKGMFVRPEQIAAIGKSVEGAGRLRLVITRRDEQDRMTLRIEHDDREIAEKAKGALERVTRLKGDVEVVELGSLPNDGKVIADERDYG